MDIITSRKGKLRRNDERIDARGTALGLTLDAHISTPRAGRFGEAWNGSLGALMDELDEWDAAEGRNAWEWALYDPENPDADIDIRANVHLLTYGDISTALDAFPTIVVGGDAHVNENADAIGWALRHGGSSTRVNPFGGTP